MALDSLISLSTAVGEGADAATETRDSRVFGRRSFVLTVISTAQCAKPGHRAWAGLQILR